MRHFMIFILAALLLGCASKPPLPQIESKIGDRVGVLFDIGENPTHTHVGTTIANNFTKKYPYKWNLSSGVVSAVIKTLENAGFTVINLNNEGIAYSDLVGLMVAEGRTWKIPPEKESTMRRLTEHLNLKGVVALKDARVLLALECLSGCTERYADGPGIYTRTFFWPTRYKAAAAFDWQIYSLNPPTNLVRSNALQKFLQYPIAPMAEFTDPVDFDNITEAEFFQVRYAIIKFSENVANEAAKVLNPK